MTGGARSGEGGHPANERLKGRWPLTFRISVLAATLFHTLAFTLWPAAEVSLPRHGQLRVMELAPHPLLRVLVAELPRRPAPIELAAMPVAAEMEDASASELTMPIVSIDDVAATELPQPPVGLAADEVARSSTFMPARVQPELLNRQELARRLLPQYQRVLSWTRARGRTVVRLSLDENGEVEDYQILHSSGDRALDRVAERAVPLMRFSPALEFGRPMATVVILPVNFHWGGP